MREIIIELIASCREGETWDFKEKHHENNAALVHDILAMTNQTNENDRYIIIGVKDPMYSAEIVGVNQEHRKSQSNIINLFQNLKFAGDIKPDLEVKTILIEDKEIDVIVIHPIREIPVYLVSDYRCQDKVVKSNYIYTRVGDTNTPINKSCDLYHLEKMWRKRFGIDKTSLERFKLLLDDIDDWNIDIGNKEIAYHSYYPEYNITFGETEEFYEPFSGSYLNHKSYSGKLILKFHTTVLYESEYWLLDEARLCIPASKTSSIEGIENSFYCYFIKNDINGKLLKLFTNGTYNLSSRYFGGSQFLIFENKDDKDQFENYLKNNYSELDKYEPSFDAQEARKYQMKINTLTAINPLIASKIKSCYEEQKNNF